MGTPQSARELLSVELVRYAETPNITVNLKCSLTVVTCLNTVNGASGTVVGASNSGSPRTGRPCLEPGSVVVNDNCPTNHSDGGLVLQEFLGDINIEKVCMPAYSPDVNPAEYVFGKIRTVMKYKLGNITNTSIHQCVPSLYTCSIRLYYSGRYARLLQSDSQILKYQQEQQIQFVALDIKFNHMLVLISTFCSSLVCNCMH